MSHRQNYVSDIPQYIGESGEIAELQDGEEDEAMEEVVDEQGYGEPDFLTIVGYDALWKWQKRIRRLCVLKGFNLDFYLVG